MSSWCCARRQRFAADFLVLLLLPSFFAAERLAPGELDFFASVLAAAVFVLVDLRVDVFLAAPVFLAVDFVAVFLVPVVFFAVDFVVVFFAGDLAVVFFAVDFVAVFFAPVVFLAEDFLVVDFAVVDLVVVFFAPVVFLAVLFFAVDFVALAVVVLRVELAAARVTLGTVASSLAGTRTSCVKDVEPHGRRSSYKKIALRGDGCQHLRDQISGVTHPTLAGRCPVAHVHGPHVHCCGRRTEGNSAATTR